MSAADQYFKALGKDFVTLLEIAPALDLSYSALDYRLRQVKPEDHPNKHGAFRLGGTTVMSSSSAANWVDHHNKTWVDRRLVGSQKS